MVDKLQESKEGARFSHPSTRLRQLVTLVQLHKAGFSEGKSVNVSRPAVCYYNLILMLRVI